MRSRTFSTRTTTSSSSSEWRQSTGVFGMTLIEGTKRAEAEMRDSLQKTQHSCRTLSISRLSWNGTNSLRSLGRIIIWSVDIGKGDLYIVRFLNGYIASVEIYSSTTVTSSFVFSSDSFSFLSPFFLCLCNVNIRLRLVVSPVVSGGGYHYIAI